MNAESARIALARESASTWSVQRVRGRHGVLAYVLASIAAGRGWPSAAQIAAVMGWRSERSARDALNRLEADGLIRKAGSSRRRTLWEVTATGTAPVRTWAFSPRPRGTKMNEPDNGLGVATSLSGTGARIVAP